MEPTVLHRPFWRRFEALWLLFPVALLFWQLAYAPFWNPDEGRYTAASFEMAFGLGKNSANWLIPHLNTVPRLNKPPLVYWLAASCFRVFGPSEWSARLVPALAALVVLLVLFAWNRARFGARAGVFTAGVWATMLLPFALARTLNTDMLLTAAITLALWGLSGAIRSSLRSGMVAGLGLGLALLAKGPVGVALPLGIFAAHALWTRRTRAVQSLGMRGLAVALGLGLGLGLPWFFAVQMQRGDFLQRFLFSENLARFSGGGEFHESKPLFFYLPISLIGMFPWTGFCGGLWARWARSDEEKQTRLFWWLWFGLVVGFFSLSGTKLISYILPAFPALALLLGAALSRLEWWPKTTRNASVALTVFALFLLATVPNVVPAREKTTKSWVWKPGVLRNDRILPREEAAPFLTGLTFLCLLGASGLLVAAKREKWREVVGVQCATGAALLLCLLPLAGKIARYEDASGLFVALRPHLRPDDRIVAFKTFAPSAIFYSARPCTQFGFDNSSGLSPKELAASPFFPAPSPSETARILRAPGRVFWLIRRGKNGPFLPQLRLWGQNNDFLLLSNRPKPTDFSFDNVAPAKFAQVASAD